MRGVSLLLKRPVDPSGLAGREGGVGMNPRGNVATLEPPFEPGNTAAVKHGAYSLAANQPRAQQIADELRPHVPSFTARLEPLLNMTALWMARLERSEAWLAEYGDVDSKGRLQPLHGKLSTWYAELRRCLVELGMTNTAVLRKMTLGDLAREIEQVHQEAGSDA